MTERMGPSKSAIVIVALFVVCAGCLSASIAYAGGPRASGTCEVLFAVGMVAWAVGLMTLVVRHG